MDAYIHRFPYAYAEASVKKKLIASFFLISYTHLSVQTGYDFIDRRLYFEKQMNRINKTLK
jgi:general stress protein CsbA